jgi:eukaryotic-like serine/threonine-protein kinase
VLQARARTARARGDLAGAERTLGEVVAIYTDSARTESNPFAHAQQTLGHLDMERGRFAAAESSYRTALGVRTRIGANALEIANSEGDLAVARARQGHLAEAESLVARSLVAKRAWIGDDHPETVDDRAKQAQLALLRGDAAAAERGYRDAIRRYAAAGDVPFWRLAPALDGMGEAELRLGRPAAAEATLRRGLDALAAAQTAPSAQRASILAHLGEAALALGRPAEARRLLGEAAAIYRALGGPNDARARACEAVAGR